MVTLSIGKWGKPEFEKKHIKKELGENGDSE